MCCRRSQRQRLLQAGLPVQPQQLSGCAARRQQRRELKALAVNDLSVVDKGLFLQSAAPYPHWTEYQPRTMAGIFVMGVALGLQEGGKKIKEKRDERKAKKAALAPEVHGPAESSSSGAARGPATRRDSKLERKSEEARREQQRRSFSSERAHEEDAPPSYDEVARPTYEEATREDQRRV
ncbi:hypothetical protein EKO04_005508 [Ascochyta lentis]|uniref:Uncharacterized protein n=1 Tax=Ascochyta lentis TaxID=205686 RepID=A0A8H7MJ09_9PLEO|nr:hypothetical protein EKO04_005508 [Ascochyta lentis]